MFLTLGNDLAFGGPLFSILYPELLAYDLFMCCISELFFNPMSYFLFEYAQHKKTPGTPTKLGKILFNVLCEPMVIFAVLGLLCNAIFNIWLGSVKNPVTSQEKTKKTTFVYTIFGIHI